MLLINVLIKNLMKKVKITKNSTPMSDLLLHTLTSNSTLIQIFLSFCIKIIVTLFLIYNSLILFSHKNLSSYLANIIFALVTKKVFLLSKNNLMSIIHILVCYVYFSFVHQAVKKLNQTRAITGTSPVRF